MKPLKFMRAVWNDKRIAKESRMCIEQYVVKGFLVNHINGKEFGARLSNDLGNVVKFCVTRNNGKGPVIVRVMEYSMGKK